MLDRRKSWFPAATWRRKVGTTALLLLVVFVFTIEIGDDSTANGQIQVLHNPTKGFNYDQLYIPVSIHTSIFATNISVYEIWAMYCMLVML